MCALIHNREINLLKLKVFRNENLLGFLYGYIWLHMDTCLHMYRNIVYLYTVIEMSMVSGYITINDARRKLNSCSRKYIYKLRDVGLINFYKFEDKKQSRVWLKESEIEAALKPKV
jgi:hypothetical protein